jgi:hypothetical protein
MRVLPEDASTISSTRTAMDCTLLDVFTMSDRGVGNYNRVQELRMNNGNRTWRPDNSMREFACTVILTDTDGDGRAEELVFQRGRVTHTGADLVKTPNIPSTGLTLMQEISSTHERSKKRPAYFHSNSFNLASDPGTSSTVPPETLVEITRLTWWVLYQQKFVVYTPQTVCAELALSRVGRLDYVSRWTMYPDGLCSRSRVKVNQCAWLTWIRMRVKSWW